MYLMPPRWAAPAPWGGATSDRLHCGVVDDPIKTLIYAADSGDVERVIVDGRTVLADGKAPGLDEAALMAAVCDAHRWQGARLAAQNPTGKPFGVLFPSSYPVVEAPA